MKTRKRAFVTGAASGIGKATALRFASEGYDLCVNDLQVDKLKEVMQQLGTGDHILLSGDCTDERFLAGAGTRMHQQWGSLDVLVNCAGIFAQTSSIHTPLQEWSVVFDHFITSALLSSRLAVSLMSSGGRIIHITSIHGERVEQNASSYAIAKAAVNQYCRSLAVELASSNILVNAIAPGFVRTPMSIVDGEDELSSPWFIDNYINGHHLPLRRAAEPEEIAGVAFFLAGADASYITGQVINVDGGLTLTF